MTAVAGGAAGWRIAARRLGSPRRKKVDCQKEEAPEGPAWAKLEPKVNENVKTKRVTAKEMRSAAEAAGKVSFTIKGRYTIDPQRSRWIQELDVALALALFYTSIVTPVEVAFLTGSETLFYLNQVMNLVFVADVMTQFFTHYQQPKVKGGAWVRNHGMIVGHYLRGNFLLDFTATFPFELVSRFERRNHVRAMAKVRLLKLLRLTKLFRIMASSRLVTRYRSQLTMSYGLLTLGQFVGMTVVVCHWFACIWGFVGNLDTNDDVSNSWKRKFETGSYKWSVENPRNQYLISVYFATMTLTTVGYGDVTPQNLTEYSVILVAMFFGGFTWAFVIGQVCAVASTMDIKRIEHRQIYDQINNMLVDSAISTDLACDVRAYLFQTEDMERRKTFPGLLDYLSPALQQHLCDELSAKHFAAVHYLRNRSNRFRLAIFKAMTTRMFCPQEVVDDAAGSLLIVANQGFMGADGKIYTGGTAVNRDFLAFNSPNRHIVALSYVQVYIFTRRQLDNVLEYYPDERLFVLWFRVFYGVLAVAEKVRRRRIDQTKPHGNLTRSLTCAAVTDGHVLKLRRREVPCRRANSESYHHHHHQPPSVEKATAVSCSAETTSSSFLDERLRANGLFLRHCELPQRDDPKLVRTAVASHPEALQYATPRLRADPEIVALAIEKTRA
ncbi:hypothetical protein CTAYLR_002967 [Chrysophaeum taylorii]|uniref:Ion transport domain-containing protein n=1 Tax=Chrysophaeum taylorii TaxID=2483200 RepID=A0AAD7XHA2_9STRA|nr:hypothetical protein CTAYLR_002967 [Chrysophaeum taylorii]